MNEPAPQDPRNPLEILRKLQLTVADVHAHVIDPAHVRDSKVAVDSPASRYPTCSRLSQIFSFLYTLNTDKLAKALHNLLSPGLMGYAAAWRAQKMLEDGIGLDREFRRDTNLGTLYAKGGWWRSDEGKVEQSNAFFLPGGIELIVLANSPLCHPDRNFMGDVSNAINDSIELWLASVASNVLGRIGAGG